MPTYDFQCERCFAVHEQLVNAAITMTPCLSCNAPAKRLVSAPAGIRMGDGRARRKAQRITEPTWVYPDGHRESLNSANTRPEEP